MLSNNPDRLAVGSDLLVVTDTGQRTLRIDAARPHQDRWLVQFAGVGDRNAAQALAGGVLHAPPVTDDPDSYWVHDLVGAEVVDADGTERGTVVGVLANPASDILELNDGTLVPLRFAQWDDPAPDGSRRLRVDGPDGLFGASDAH